MNNQRQKIISDICPHYKEYGSCEKCREDDVFLDGEPCYYECMANEIIKNGYVKLIAKTEKGELKRLPCQMTLKDKLNIQRTLGIIEGVSLMLEDKYKSPIADCLDIINWILEGYEKGGE